MLSTHTATHFKKRNPNTKPLPAMFLFGTSFKGFIPIELGRYQPRPGLGSTLARIEKLLTHERYRMVA